MDLVILARRFPLVNCKGERTQPIKPICRERIEKVLRVSYPEVEVGYRKNATRGLRCEERRDRVEVYVLPRPAWVRLFRLCDWAFELTAPFIGDQFEPKEHGFDVYQVRREHPLGKKRSTSRQRTRTSY